MLQEQNIDKLTEAFVDRTKEVCPSLLADARATATRYNTLLKLYAKCDNLFNRGDFLTQEEIHSLGEFICVHKLTHYMYYSMSKEQHKLTSKWSNICLFLLAFIRIDKFIPKKGMEDRLNLSVICYLRSLGNVKCWRPKTQFNCFFFIRNRRVSERVPQLLSHQLPLRVDYTQAPHCRRPHHPLVPALGSWAGPHG